MVLGVEGEGEDDPDGREDDHGEGEGVELPAGPVLDGALPQVTRVRLHRRVGDHLYSNTRYSRFDLRVQ